MNNQELNNRFSELATPLVADACLRLGLPLRIAPKFMLQLIHLPPRLIYAIGLGSLIGNVVLLLTTLGRKSGKPRVTPLQYEDIDGKIYLGAAFGQKAD